MARRYRLGPSRIEMPIRDRILNNLYSQELGPARAQPQAPQLPTSPLAPAMENQVFGGEAAERNAVLLRRLLRAEAQPPERSRFNIVE